MKKVLKRGSKRGLRSILFLAMAALVFAGSIQLRAEEHYIPGDLSGKNIAMIISEGFHDGETLFPLGFLSNRGAEVTIVGSEPGFVKAYNSDTWVRIERSVDETDPAAYDAIVIPGGRSPANLREKAQVVDFTLSAVEQGSIAAAICHGPQLLIRAGVLSGREATAFPDVSEELMEAGAIYEDVPMMRDGQFITSRVPDDLPDFVRAIEEALLE